MAIRKNLIPYGSSLALVIDRPILDLIGISKTTPLDITTDGSRLVITPVVTSASGASDSLSTPTGASGAAHGRPDPDGVSPEATVASQASQPGEAAMAAPPPTQDGVVRAAPWMGNYAPARLIRGDHRIRLMVTSNPKRDGSASRARFDWYRDGMSVDEAYSAGILAADVRWDLAHGFIELY